MLHKAHLKYIFADFQTFYRRKKPSQKKATHPPLYLWIQNTKGSVTELHMLTWVLPFCTGVNPARCSGPLIHSSWRHLSSCLMLSTFISTDFLHSFCLRQTDLLTRHYVFSHLSNKNAWSFCRRFEIRTADVTALLCCNKNEGYYYKYNSILTSAFMVFISIAPPLKLYFHCYFDTGGKFSKFSHFHLHIALSLETISGLFCMEKRIYNINKYASRNVSVVGALAWSWIFKYILNILLIGSN